MILQSIFWILGYPNIQFSKVVFDHVHIIHSFHYMPFDPFKTFRVALKNLKGDKLRALASSWFTTSE